MASKDAEGGVAKSTLRDEVDVYASGAGVVFFFVAVFLVAAFLVVAFLVAVFFVMSAKRKLAMKLEKGVFVLDAWVEKPTGFAR